MSTYREERNELTNMLQTAEEANAKRQEVIEYLQSLDVEVVRQAGVNIKLPRFAKKLHQFTGDVSTTMLVKVMRELAK